MPKAAVMKRERNSHALPAETLISKSFCQSQHCRAIYRPDAYREQSDAIRKKSEQTQECRCRNSIITLHPSLTLTPLYGSLSASRLSVSFLLASSHFYPCRMQTSWQVYSQPSGVCWHAHRTLWSLCNDPGKVQAYEGSAHAFAPPCHCSITAQNNQGPSENEIFWKWGFMPEIHTHTADLGLLDNTPAHEIAP